MTIHVDARDCHPATEPSRKARFSEILGRVIEHWRNRRTARRLMDLDDHMLADIGVLRGDVLQTLGSGGEVDPNGSLGRLARRRKRRG